MSGSNRSWAARTAAALWPPGSRVDGEGRSASDEPDAGAGTGRAGASRPEWPERSFEDLIGTTRFDVHRRAHIVVDDTVCRTCPSRECIVACPAKLFVTTADGGILFNYEQCFECGTCYLVCNNEGAITWTYPEGGHGVVFRQT